MATTLILNLALLQIMIFIKAHYYFLFPPPPSNISEYCLFGGLITHSGNSSYSMVNDRFGRGGGGNQNSEIEIVVNFLLLKHF